MKLNKKKWFYTQVVEFEINYKAYPAYPDNYKIMSYITGHAFAKAPCLTTYCDTYDKPQEIKDIINYFKSLSVIEAFFKALRIARKHKKQNKECYISVSYKTLKQRDKKIKELL